MTRSSLVFQEHVNMFYSREVSEGIGTRLVQMSVLICILRGSCSDNTTIPRLAPSQVSNQEQNSDYVVA